MAEDWSDREIDLAVADYFAMLAKDISGEPYVKRAHNRALQDRLGRSHGSIEFKHQNISAVLRILGQPWIMGYKPAMNFQHALVDGVLRWLDAHPLWLDPAPRTGVVGGAGMAEPRALWIDQPPGRRNAPDSEPPAEIAELARRYKVAERDEANRALGRAGEALILDHERRGLIGAGRPDLARRVVWTSEDEGDGFGYDVHSFEPDGRDRLLEVKTTNGWERTPFHITRNELAVAEARRREWSLIRVWNFAREPKAFALTPPLDAHVALTPTTFLAAFP